MHNLDQIQRWMQAVITHPHGVEQGVASDAARAELDVNEDQLEQVVTRSRALSAVDRLEVYANAYHARLVECLREEFPALVHALGDGLFNTFASGYLQAYPSQSYTLNDLAGRFPQYLQETRPEAESGDGLDAAWPDFLIDLATLELTFCQVFDGPGVERSSLLDQAQLQAIPLELWPQTRLIPVPCLRLLALRFPVQSYYSAVRKQQPVVLPDAAETLLAVTRRDYVVCHYPLARCEFELLRSLIEGKTVGDAIALAAQQPGARLDDLARNLQMWFERWSREGFFSGVETRAPEAAE